MTDSPSLDVLIIAFNRPEQLARVCTALRSRDDLRIYVALDGPRESPFEDIKDVEACAEVVDALLGDKVVATRRSPANLGCAVGATTAISWFLSQVSEGVILEDDCVPTSEFLDFARVMLANYRHDVSVAAICGVNYAPADILPPDALAVRSRHLMLWGWATWRRAWAGFDVNAVGVRGLDRGSVTWSSLTPVERRDWAKMMNSVSPDSPHTWDYQLIAHMWRKDQRVILPRIPLVDNIGFETGVHYAGGQPPAYYRSTDPGDLKAFKAQLCAEANIHCVDDGRLVDRWISRNIFSPPLPGRLLRRVTRLMRGGRQKRSSAESE